MENNKIFYYYYKSNFYRDLKLLIEEVEDYYIWTILGTCGTLYPEKNCVIDIGKCDTWNNSFSRAVELIIKIKSGKKVKKNND